MLVAGIQPEFKMEYFDNNVRLKHLVLELGEGGIQMY